ncbi:MAG: single-stranded DNA-binding protein [Lachnospiraceae bacterium]|nr:single-stranded DNA-binding protein [Lachnospiraceae bacterium]
MNKVIFMGRLTRDPEVRYGGASGGAIARYSIAVDRRFKRDGQPTADFFNCTAFGKLGEFVEKYLRKGTKIVMEGEIQNDNYTNSEGKTVYGFNIIANNIEFAESKNASGGGDYQSAPAASQGAPSGDPGDGFMQIPDGLDEELPFS